MNRKGVCVLKMSLGRSSAQGMLKSCWNYIKKVIPNLALWFYRDKPKRSVYG